MSAHQRSGISQTKRWHIKIAAFMVVLLMAVSPLASMIPEQSEATVGDGRTYTYTLNYDSTKMGTDSTTAWNSSFPLSVSNMTPIYHPSYSNGTATGYGSWEWNTKTGLGPFNSFYAAFDLTDGNKFYAILDPFNLTKTIDGEQISSDDLKKYNVMWVLPTVYIKSTATSLTLSNDPNSGGTAYAHTIDGHVYKYIAIGVYEGSTTDITVGDSNKTVLTSVSGVSPTVSKDRSEFRTYAHNYGEDGQLDSSLETTADHHAYGMLWNFYQWELYRYCSMILMENFNSQAVVGGGHVYGSTKVFTTGATDMSGPFAGTPLNDMYDSAAHGTDQVKLLIEGFWGGLSELVDGVLIKDKEDLYISTKSTPDDDTEGCVVYNGAIYSGTGNELYPAAPEITTGEGIWGLGKGSTVANEKNGTTDRMRPPANNDLHIMAIGGGTTNEYTAGSASYGMNYIYAISPTDKGGHIGSRLAFVFDQSVYNVVSFDMRGHGEQVPDQYIQYADAVAEPPQPFQKNCIFRGWYSDKATTALWDFSTPVYNNMTLYALWDIQTHQPTGVILEFEAIGGGTVSPSKISVPLGSVITVDGDKLKILNGPEMEIVKAVPNDGYALQSWDLTEHVAVSDATVKVTFKKAELEGISVYTAPSKLVYSPGESFDPNGLILTLEYRDGSDQLLQYRGNESLFSFTPYLDEPLKMSDKYVTITYKDVSVQQEISVKDASPGLDWTVVLLVGVVIAVIIAILALSFVKRHPDNFQ